MEKTLSDDLLKILKKHDENSRWFIFNIKKHKRDNATNLQSRIIKKLLLTEREKKFFRLFLVPGNNLYFYIQLYAIKTSLPDGFYDDLEVKNNYGFFSIAVDILKSFNGTIQTINPKEISLILLKNPDLDKNLVNKILDIDVPIENKVIFLEKIKKENEKVLLKEGNAVFIKTGSYKGLDGIITGIKGEKVKVTVKVFNLPQEIEVLEENIEIRN